MEKAKKIKIETLPMSAGGKATKPPIKIEEKRGSCKKLNKRKKK